MKLENGRVLITGGGSGIGKAIARECRARGARVVINGRDEARLGAAAEELDVSAVVGDVGTDGDAERIVAESVALLGGLDVLVNNAGTAARMALEELDAARFETLWRTNVLGAALMAQASVPHLEKRGGNIVNIGSTAGLKGYANASAYVATKFALRGMSECWRAELRPRNIRVVLISPSEVQTPFGGRSLDDLNPHKLLAEDIAHAVVAALEMHDRGFIPELSVFATNPWRDA